MEGIAERLAAECMDSFVAEDVTPSGKVLTST